MFMGARVAMSRGAPRLSAMDTTNRGRLREHTAAELRALLARRRLSAAEFARRVGWSQPYMARRYDGRVAMDLDDLEVIAAALGVKVTDLIGESEGGSQATHGKLRVSEQRPGGPVRPTANRPRDGRPKARPSAQVPSPHTRRPVRVPSIGRAVASAA